MRILLTAFEPYAEWPTNSSWLTLVTLLRHRSPNAHLVTRRYPVDFGRLQQALHKDLVQDFDAVLHLGQAPGSPMIRLEALAINAGGSITEAGSGTERLVSGAPEAYRTRMPLERWARLLQERSLPAQISYHAGIYLCNAVMFLSHHWMAQAGKTTPVGFVHLPLTTQQVADSHRPLPSLPVETLAQAVATLLDDLQQPAAEVAQLVSRQDDRV